MAELGCNSDGRAAIAPASLAEIYAAWTRCVAYRDVDKRAWRDWAQRCRARGTRVLLVLGGESIGTNPAYWAENIATLRDDYQDIVDAWQLGNESDHGLSQDGVDSASSWTMYPDELSSLLQVGRNILGPDAYIVGAGMASGQPAWAWRVNWSPVSAVACHPYAKDPGSAALNWMLGAYRALGKPLWVTEYHARSLGMAAYLRDDARLEVALAFCYTDTMVDGFGLIEDANALADFKAAARPQASAPTPPPAGPHFEHGFAAWDRLHPGLLGTPRTNETGVWAKKVALSTTTGALFWDDGDFTFVQRDGRIWRWHGGWDHDEEVATR